MHSYELGNNAGVLVLNPYTIVECGGVRYIKGSDKEETEYEYYNPLKVIKEIITYIDKNYIPENVNCDEVIIEFCNRYGLFGSRYAFTCQKASQDDMFKSYLENFIMKYILLTPTESSNDNYLDALNKEGELRKRSSLFVGIEQTTFIEPLEEVKNLIIKIKHLLKYFTILKHNARVLSLDDQISKAIETHCACKFINDLLDGVTHHIYYSDSGFLYEFHFTTLLQALGIHFAEMAVYKKGFVRCEYSRCRKLFIPTYEKQRHCPVPENDIRITKSKRGNVISRCKINADAEKRAGKKNNDSKRDKRNV